MDEKITFTIHKIGSNMCRITANTILSAFHEIADGGCICTLDVLLNEMKHITNEVRDRFHAKAVFEFVDFTG